MHPYYHTLINNGIKIVINELIQPFTTIKQVRFPKSKKKRIRKKWSMRTINFKSEYHDDFYMIDNKTIVMNSNQFQHAFGKYPSIIK